VDSVLVSPLAASGVMVFVTVRAGEHFEVFEPSLCFMNNVLATAAVSDMPGFAGGASLAPPQCVELAPSIRPPWATGVASGERIVHLRQLLHRYSPVVAFADPAVGSGTGVAATSVRITYPRRGYVTQYSGVPGASSYWADPYAYNVNSFVGETGGHRYRVIPVSPGINGSVANLMWLSKLGVYDPFQVLTQFGSAVQVVGQVDIYGAIRSILADNGYSSVGLTPSAVDHGHVGAINLPYQCPQRFLVPDTRASGATYIDPSLLCVKIGAGTLPAGQVGSTHLHHAVGDDFSFFGFLYSPRLTSATTPH